MTEALRLYVQQWAWLNTRAKDQSQSRSSFLEDAAGRLPDVEPFGYMIETLVRAGVAMSSGQGISGLTWQELEAFKASTGIDLTGWESHTIRELSSVYASSVMSFDNKDVPAPYKTNAEKVRLASSLKSILRQAAIKDDRRS